MAEDVTQSIAQYLQKIHDELVRPVILDRSSNQYRPDRLISFQEVLMRAHFRATSLFKRPAQADKGATAMQLGSMECQADEDCNENEKCIYGECVPIPFGIEFAPVDAQPSYGDEVSRAWADYSERTYQVLVNGLAANPRRLANVRDELMRMYAEAALAGGAVRSKCDETNACEDGQGCVKGICVPIPFRLVFRRLPGARPDSKS